VLRASILSSPHLKSTTRESSWPLEGFADLHLSGSEPRIFPGVVSRTQRRDSLVRKGSVSETDRGVGRGVDGAVEEESDDYLDGEEDSN
jgi:AMP deaminase